MRDCCSDGRKKSSSLSLCMSVSEDDCRRRRRRVSQSGGGLLGPDFALSFSLPSDERRSNSFPCVSDAGLLLLIMIDEIGGGESIQCVCVCAGMRERMRERHCWLQDYGTATPRSTHFSPPLCLSLCMCEMLTAGSHGETSKVRETRDDAVWIRE